MVNGESRLQHGDGGTKTGIAAAPTGDPTWRRAVLWTRWLLALPSLAAGIIWTVAFTSATGCSWFLVLVFTGVEAAFLFFCVLRRTTIALLIGLLAWTLAGGSLLKSGPFCDAFHGADPRAARNLWQAAGCLGVGVLLLIHMNHR